MTRYGRLPTGTDKVRAVRSMFDSIAPRYDLVNRVMTFGLDVGWRRATVRALGLERDAVVFDVACGTGDLCKQLDRDGLVPIGFDFSFGMLAESRVTVPLVQADALRLPVEDACADGLTCGFALRNVADLGAFFDECARVVRPTGRISLLEVAEPETAWLRAGHRLYFRRVVPVIGGLLSDRRAYLYLPESTAYLPPSDELLGMLRAAGFASVERRLLGLGAAQIISATRR